MGYPQKMYNKLALLWGEAQLCLPNVCLEKEIGSCHFSGQTGAMSIKVHGFFANTVLLKRIFIE